MSSSSSSLLYVGQQTEMPIERDSHCTRGALTDKWGLLIQGILAFLAFCSLILKRFCEPKACRRPWSIWFFDTSKQGFGALVLHFSNVFLSDMFQGDPCTWYIISFLLDASIGMILVYMGLKVTQWIIVYKQCDSLVFGEYGKPPQCNAWAGQCGLYMLVMVVEKVIVTLILQAHFWADVRRWIMAPITDPKLEVVLVMLVIPFVLNTFMFWIVDNFLMHKSSNESFQAPSASHRANSTDTQHTDMVRFSRFCDKEDDCEAEVLLLNTATEEIECHIRSSSTEPPPSPPLLT